MSTPEQAVPDAAEDHSSRQSDDLLGLTLELAGSLDARTVMRNILERGLAMASADRATLSSFTRDQLVIEASVGRGGEITWVGRSYDADVLVRQPLVADLVVRRQTVLGGPMVTAEAMPEFRSALAGVRHTALVPILEGDELAGMVVLSRYSDEPFDGADLPGLTGFGAVAGLALRNAKLYEAATSTARRLQAATDAAADVAARQELPALLQRIIEHATAAASADSGSVMRLEAGDAVIEATSGIAPVGSRWPLDEEARAAIGAGRPLRIDTTTTAVAGDLAQYAAPYSHALIAPLCFAGELLGILVLGRFQGRERFSDDDINGLQHFITLAALMLRNGRLVHQLREAEKMKREFTNIAVHELRGPLTVIDGYAELLISGGSGRLDTEVERQLETIRRQATHARALAEDLLILAQLESDELGVSHDSIVVADVVSAAIERALPRARLRSGAIEMPDAADVHAAGDARLAARVLDNLLANAVAYATEAPLITVTITSAEDVVAVRVQDNGPGIDDDERERVFARFARGRHTAATRGTGLGLYLSRECARRMGGDLVLEETASGAGSRFLLTLPAAAPSR
jgi:signal transduction histidine kinase